MADPGLQVKFSPYLDPHETMSYTIQAKRWVNAGSIRCRRYFTVETYQVRSSGPPFKAITVPEHTKAPRSRLEPYTVSRLAIVGKVIDYKLLIGKPSRIFSPSIRTTVTVRAVCR